ncbi:hypothetical protein GCM10009606_17960 [Nocardioides aquiterrae]|uniref:Uncharacterized protein n=1 Tax=Nocardioides aquiterrae TaxID=203799 RepID=A0ABN1UCT0_9ACTN
MTDRIPPRHSGYRPAPSTSGFDPATDPRPAPPTGRGGGSLPIEEAASGTRRLQCAFALHRGRYCRLPYGHDGDHAPNRQIDQETTR